VLNFLLIFQVSKINLNNNFKADIVVYESNHQTHTAQISAINVAAGALINTNFQNHPAGDIALGVLITAGHLTYPGLHGHERFVLPPLKQIPRVMATIAK
jgi:hypothetical protein